MALSAYLPPGCENSEHVSYDRQALVYVAPDGNHNVFQWHELSSITLEKVLLGPHAGDILFILRENERVVSFLEGIPGARQLLDWLLRPTGSQTEAWLEDFWNERAARWQCWTNPSQSRDVPGRRVIETGLPGPGIEAYEYALPLQQIPAEADPEWQTWLAPLVGLDAAGVYGMVQQRFERSETQFTLLRDRVLEYSSPYAILVYLGVPLLWLRREPVEHDFIYLPPETSRKALRQQLAPYGLSAEDAVADLLANFGGMGERWPWEAVEFDGPKFCGGTITTESDESFSTVSDKLSQKKKLQFERDYARWLGGITILNGDDGRVFNLSRDGAICDLDRYWITEPPEPKYASLQEMIEDLFGDWKLLLFDKVR